MSMALGKLRYFQACAGTAQQHNSGLNSLLPVQPQAA